MSYWVNRTLCDVLEEMRTCSKTKNFASIDGLIEEVQIVGNRMESALGDLKDIPKMNKEWHELKNKIKVLKNEKKDLEKVLGKEKEKPKRILERLDILERDNE